MSAQGISGPEGLDQRSVNSTEQDSAVPCTVATRPEKVPPTRRQTVETLLTRRVVEAPVAVSDCVPRTAAGT
jgi:hypothetical protein